MASLVLVQAQGITDDDGRLVTTHLPAAVAALRSGCITKLCVASAHWNLQNWAQLAEAVMQQRSEHLTLLDLSNTGRGSTERTQNMLFGTTPSLVHAVLAHDQCPNLTDLVLARCKLTDHNIMALTNAVMAQGQATKLKRLILSDNCIDDNAATRLARMLWKGFCPNLVLLDLSSNKIGDVGGSLLADVVEREPPECPCPRLGILSLSFNFGMKATTKVRVNNALKKLDGMQKENLKAAVAASLDAPTDVVAHALQQDPDAPQPPTSACVRWSKAESNPHRERIIRAATRPWSQGIRTSALMNRLAAMWESGVLTEAEKAPWLAAAHQDGARYEAERAAYVAGGKAEAFVVAQAADALRLEEQARQIDEACARTEARMQQQQHFSLDGGGGGGMLDGGGGIVSRMGQSMQIGSPRFSHTTSPATDLCFPNRGCDVDRAVLGAAENAALKANGAGPAAGAGASLVLRDLPTSVTPAQIHAYLAECPYRPSIESVQREMEGLVPVWRIGLKNSEHADDTAFDCQLWHQKCPFEASRAAVQLEQSGPADQEAAQSRASRR